MCLKLKREINASVMHRCRSFHRSLQSAAFLQLLLLCVAVSSRMRAVSLEMQGLTQQTIASITRLLAIHKVSGTSPMREDPLTAFSSAKHGRNYSLKCRFSDGELCVAPHRRRLTIEPSDSNG